MERVIISFNLPNIITVTIMAAVGWAAFGLLRQAMLQTNAGGGSGAVPTLGGY